IEHSLREAIVSEGLRPAAGPRIERQALARNRGLEYTAEFEIYPEIKKLDIAGSTIERPVAAVADEDVERTLETIRKQRTTWNPVEREARLGDRVKIDFAGRLNGEALPGGTAKDFFAVLGSGTLIDDLEKGLVGAKAGETRQVLAKFPADYRHQPLAGQSVEFDVSLHEAAEPVLPEVDAEFAKQLGVQDGNVEQLRAEVKQNLEREAAQRTRRIVRARTLKALLEGNNFDIPKGMIDAEVAGLRRMEQASGTAGQIPDAELQERAGQRVTVGLVLAEIIRQRGIKAEPARVRTKLEEMAAEYEQPAAFVQWHYEQPQRMAQIESLVMEDRALEELLGQAKVEERTVTFQELLQLESQTS
ncbi:MAG TPA: trigger factor, partial [Burkholderiales bacterium]|nr:trigger factor [Burkholderiales bacterium]